MQSTANIENISISIPITDLSFLRTLSKKMGWTIKRQRKSGIDRALDDIKAGRVYEVGIWGAARLDIQELRWLPSV